jgi:hypothetical protein
LALRLSFGASGPLAQLDRALPSEGRGREFESRRVRQISSSSLSAAAGGADITPRSLSPSTARLPTCPAHDAGSAAKESAALVATLPRIIEDDVDLPRKIAARHGSHFFVFADALEFHILSKTRCVSHRRSRRVLSLPAILVASRK